MCQTTFEDILRGSPQGWDPYQQHEPSTISQERGVLPPLPPIRYVQDDEEVEPPVNLTQALGIETCNSCI